MVKEIGLSGGDVRSAVPTGLVASALIIKLLAVARKTIAEEPAVNGFAESTLNSALAKSEWLW